MSGPAEGRRSRAPMLRALLPCLALVVWDTTRAGAQTAPPPDLFRPAPDGSASAQDLPLRKTIAATSDDFSRSVGQWQAQRPEHARAVADRAAPDLWCSGCQRRFRHRLRFAQSHAQEAEAPSGRGTAEAAAGARQCRACTAPGRRGRIVAIVDPALRACQQDTAAAGDGRHGRRPAAAQAAQGR